MSKHENGEPLNTTHLLNALAYLSADSPHEDGAIPIVLPKDVFPEAAGLVSYSRFKIYRTDHIVPAGADDAT